MDVGAGVAGDARFVSVLSNSVRSFIKPALHVGVHSFGLGGCSASAGSGGIGGAGETTGAGKFVAQPAASISSTSDSALQGGDFLSGIFNLRLYSRGAAGSFIDRRLHCFRRLAHPVHALVDQLELGAPQPVGLEPGKGAHHQDGTDRSLCDHASPPVAGAEPICSETCGRGHDSGQR